MFPPCCLCLPEYHRSCPASDGALQRVDEMSVPSRQTNDHDGLDERGRRALPRPRVVDLAMSTQPARDLAGGFCGHVESGTIGDHVGSCPWTESLARTDLQRQDPTPLTRHAPFTTPLP